MGILRLDTPLFEALGAKNAFLRRFEKLGIFTVGDLLRHFPSRYDDFSRTIPIGDLTLGEEATVQGIIRDVDMKYTHRRGMAITEIVVDDGTGSIRAVWFNQPYLANAFRIGRAVNLAGKLSTSEGGELYLSNPAHEFPPAGSQTSANDSQYHTGRLVPIYPETRGLTSRGIRFTIARILKRRIALDEWIPPEIREAENLPELGGAVNHVHFPSDIEEASAAKRRFLFEDLFLLQIANLRQKFALAGESAPAIPADVEFIRHILAELPFELTPSQKKSLWEILQNMEGGRPMNRLLQGDVGSGKTIVAALAALTTAKAGFQIAFMAPTEILARQHFETMRKLFELLSGKPLSESGALSESGLPVFGLLTSADAKIVYADGLESAVKKPELQKKASDGEVAIIFGTHALIQKNVAFKNLGLVIIDEQHRFGVKQRAALLKSNELRVTSNEKKAASSSSSTRNSKLVTRNFPIPHFLSMSATPIPRTLMMTVFGDLDVSLITELPAGRRPIETKVILPLERAQTYRFVREKVKEGRQVFVICPRIEESGERRAESGEQQRSTSSPLRSSLSALRFEVDLKSVKQEYEKLSKKIFPGLRVAMLHGQMKPKEKEAIMRDFKDGKTDILVSTSVIEVGVDVPNAAVMLIEDADRFGLAQLYQFRGRIGRGEHPSYCFLFTDSESDSTKMRLAAIVSATNGFELAEKDLQLRGPGQFFGEVQSGLPDIAMEAIRDPELVKSSRDAAIRIMKTDPQFAKHPELKLRMAEFRKKIHRE